MAGRCWQGVSGDTEGCAVKRSMHDKKRLKAEVTLETGRTTVIEHSTDDWRYDTDLDRLREIYGTKNVREIKLRRKV